MGANTLIVDIDNNTVNAYNGVIDGSGGLTQDGEGTLTLGGNNTYTGNTTVRKGTLALEQYSSFIFGNISDTLILYDKTAFDTGTTNTAVNLKRLDVRGNAEFTGDLDIADGTMDFYIPTAMGDNDVMLKVADIGGSQVNVGVSIDGGTSPLKANSIYTTILPLRVLLPMVILLRMPLK
ncbi:hypothetical protein FACS189454_10040 [Planctomycetales bacterium]|nr:hypothetical protein FACS189454_10040 [Planctomycetales bacterium]